MKRFLIIQMLVFAGFAMMAQPTFTARLDTNRIVIGQQTYFQLTATGLINPNDVRWPAWPDTLKGLEVLGATSDTITQNGVSEIVVRYLITSFDSGFVLINPVVLVAGADTLKTEPLILNISTVELDPTQDYFDIKAPVNPPFDWLYWLKKLWLWAAIAAVILAVALWFWLRKRKQKEIPQVVDLRSPAQRAKDALRTLAEERLWQNGDVKGYYSRATDAVRTYLEESFRIPAMEMISDELLDAIQPKVSHTAYQLLRTALRQADMVKFAKAKPGPETHEKLLADCLEIINLTEPKTDETAG
jgi:hypothetical protein